MLKTLIESCCSFRSPLKRSSLRATTTWSIIRTGSKHIDSVSGMGKSGILGGGEGNLCDVTLTAEGRKFRVHKNVISANSTLFRTMFLGPCVQTDEEIPIDKISAVHLEKLITLMYTRKILLNLNIVEDLIAAAIFLQMERAEELFKMFLRDKLCARRHTDKTIAKNLLNCLNQFKKDESFCDVRLKSGQRTFRVHKNVICASNPYFKDILLENSSESQDVHLDAIDPDILEKLIDYIYTGTLNIDSGNVKEIMVTVMRWRIPLAETICCKFMTSDLNKETFAEYMEFSRKHSIESLRASLIEKIVEIFPDVFSNKKYLEIEFELGDIKEIIRKVNEKGHPEDLIFSFVMRWINFSEETRGKYTKDMLELLEPSLISPNVFHSLEMMNAANPMFASWASGSGRSRSPNDSGECKLFPSILNKPWRIGLPMRSRPSRSPGECILFVSISNSSKPWRIGLLSQAADCEINFLPPGTEIGSYACNGYYIYHQGGLKQGILSDTYVYHPIKHVWTPFVPLLEARACHSSCVLNQKLFSVGGRNRGRVLASVEFTDLCSGQRALIDPLPRAMTDLRLGVNENSIYIVGGFSDESVFRCDTHRFDEREGVWQSLKSPSFDKYIKSCAIVGESVYTTCEDALHRYDMRANEWETISIHDMAYPREVFSIDNTLYGLFDDIIGRFIPEKRTWVKQRTLNNELFDTRCFTVVTNILNP